MRNISHIALALLVLIQCFDIQAIPARNTTAIISQPDGSTFTALLKGDEFMKIFTTADGYAITMDAEGFYCYAEYDAEGCKHSTGIRVKGDNRADAPASSMNIPLDIIRQNALDKRAAAGIRFPDNITLMERLSSSQGSMPGTRTETKPEKKVLVLLVQYEDVKFKYQREDFVNMMSQEGYNGYGATGCAQEYFEDQFNGKVNFSFDVSEIITLSKKRAYYGANGSDGSDVRAPQMVREACIKVDNNVNFSEYDSDKDGVVDNLFLFFAGGDEAQFAGEECIWSHAWTVNADKQGELYLDGIKIDAYACTSELFTVSLDYNNKPLKMTMAGIGTFCHEYSHTLGLPDFYDTDYDKSGGTSIGFHGITSVMDSGPYNNNGRTPPAYNAVEREMLGITVPEEMKVGQNTLLPIAYNGNSMKLSTDTPDEYFLIEYRKKEKWDSFIGGSGVLIYHIDKSTNNSGYSDYYRLDLTANQRWKLNEINCNPAHQCADLIEACGNESTLIKKNIFFPHDKTLTYQPVSWNGIASNYSIYGINCYDDRADFFVGNILDEVVQNVEMEVFQDCAILSWSIRGEQAEVGTCVLKYENTSKKANYVNGKYYVYLEGLTHNTEYSLFIEFPEIEYQKQITFKTLNINPFELPYIVMNGKHVIRINNVITKGSRLPLVVKNAKNSDVTWSFNGQTIERSDDGYFTILENGILKAVINNPYGGRNIIIKEIEVK